MNLGQAQNEMRGRGFDYLDSSRLTIMLNNAKNELEDYWPWPWLLSTAIGPSPLTIPDFKLMQSVQDADSARELLYIDPRQITAGADLNQTGAPIGWYLQGPNPFVSVHTWPADVTNLFCSYTAESLELVNTIDTPLIPARYHPLWIDFAVVEAYKDSDNFGGASALRADINTRMYDLISRYEVRQRQHSYPNARRSTSEDD